jgi:hypothetical protein
VELPRLKSPYENSFFRPFPQGNLLIVCWENGDFAGYHTDSNAPQKPNTGSARATAHAKTMLSGYLAGLGTKNALPHPNQLPLHPHRSWRHSACSSGVGEYVGPVEIGTTIVSGAFAQVLAIIGCEDGAIAYEPKA